MPSVVRGRKAHSCGNRQITLAEVSSGLCCAGWLAGWLAGSGTQATQTLRAKVAVTGWTGSLGLGVLGWAATQEEWRRTAHAGRGG